MLPVVSPHDQDNVTLMKLRVQTGTHTHTHRPHVHSLIQSINVIMYSLESDDVVTV